MLRRLWEARRKRQWQPPEVGPGDQLVETVIVERDGTHRPIVIHVSATGTIRGHDRPIDLAPGAAIAIPVHRRNLP